MEGNCGYLDSKMLKMAIKGYFTDPVQYELFCDQYDMGSPVTLLSIFIGNDGHVGDFDKFNYFCENDLIYYHLEAIGNALEDGKQLGKAHYRIQFRKRFELKPGVLIPGGQAKLFFSLTYCCLKALQEGHSEVAEYGAGPDTGGKNHQAVCEVLTNSQKWISIKMYDPIHLEGKEILGSCMLQHIKGAIGMNEESGIPVFSDIYDEGKYLEIEDSIRAPFVMKKRVNAYNAYSPDVVLQPYHAEKRLLKGNKQLLNFCRATPNCSCYNCLKYAALACEFSIDKKHFELANNRLGVFCCGKGYGAKSLQRFDEAIKDYKVMEVNFDKKKFSHVVPRTPAERVLLSNHFESLGSVKAHVDSEFVSKINTDIVYYEYVEDVQYLGSPILVKVMSKEMEGFAIELAENRYIPFNEKKIGDAMYVAAVLDYTAEILPITIPRIMPGMSVIYDDCRMRMKHDNCGGRQCGDKEFYVMVRAYNHVPVKIDERSTNMYSLKDIDELSRAWKEKFTIGRMYAEDVMKKMQLPRSFLMFMIAGTMSSFKVVERVIENKYMSLTFGDLVVSVRDKENDNVKVFRGSAEFVGWVLNSKWVNVYLRNLLPWNMDQKITRRSLASYMSFDDCDSFLRRLSKDRVIIEYSERLVLSYDFLAKKREVELVGVDG